MSKKGKRKASGVHRPPASVSALHSAVSRLLAGVHPDIRVHQVGTTVLVAVGRRGVAQVSERRVRVLPDLTWEPLGISQDAIAVRERIVRAIGAGASGSANSMRGPTATKGGVVKTPTTPAPKSSAQATITPAQWAEALRALGAPAVVAGGRVTVGGAVVAVPAPGEKPKVAARAFVRRQTAIVLPRLSGRVSTAAGGGPRVRVAERKGAIVVTVDGDHVASITRYAITIGARRLVEGDLIVTGTHRFAPIGKAVREALTRRALVTAPTGPTPKAAAATRSQDGVQRSRVPARAPEATGPLQIATLHDVAAFLEGAALPVVGPAQRRLWVAGIELKPPSSALDDPDTLARWLDAFVGDRLIARLEAAARRRLGDVEPLRLETDGGSVTVCDPRGERIARIAATRAQLPDGSWVSGNFLVGGPHWEELGATVRSAADDFDDEQIAWPGLHRTLPPGIDAARAEAAHEASRRLREERSRAFEHAIRIDIAGASLEFAPVTFRDGWPVVRFVHRQHKTPLEGALRLGTTDRLLPCHWEQPTDVERLALIWTLALDAYAEISCIPRPRPQPRPRLHGASRPTAPRRRSVGSTTRDARPAPRLPSNPDVLPSTLRPLGLTSRYLASYVAGHRRRLQPGWQHSHEAVDNAARYGITLRHDETWVQPHVRGVPPDAVLHFAWQVPEWLRESPSISRSAA